jgi:zinc protease
MANYKSITSGHAAVLNVALCYHSFGLPISRLSPEDFDLNLMRHLWRGAVGAACLGLGLSAVAAPKTTEFRLDNGLKIVVQEDHRAPVVVTEVWYKVGSSYETMGQTGISHALEHMMFKGTPKVPAGEFSRIVNKFGGNDNAFTTNDFTAYYQLYAADRLPLALELEADRMANLVIDPVQFASEIQVVMEERRMRTDDNPDSIAYERFAAAAFLTSPERIPTIGWMTDIQQLTALDLRHWYETWYTPNNATLVVVGDVDPAQVKTLAQKYFGAIPARAVPKVPLPRELPEPGQRELALKLPAKVPALFIGFNVPSLNTEATPDEAYALRMMVGVLDEGSSARFETRVVRQQQVAVAIGTGYDLFGRGDTLVTINAVPNDKRSLEEVRKAVMAEIEKLKSDPIDAEEMKRVYAGILAGNVFDRDSIVNQANTIGSLESVGLGWRTLDILPQKLQAVTPEQIRAVARKYLVPARMTVLSMQPEASGAEAQP